MITTQNINRPVPNLLRSERIMRVVWGASFIGFVGAQDSGPLGAMALLPLIAIYPLATGMLGIDPIRSVLAPGSRAYRVLQFSTGLAMLGVAFIAAQEILGMYALLALIAIIPVLAAILGCSPLMALLGPAREPTINQAGYLPLVEEQKSPAAAALSTLSPRNGMEDSGEDKRLAAVRTSVAA